MPTFTRRSFIKSASLLTLGAALAPADGFAQAPAAGKIRLYRLEFYYLQLGDQVPRLTAFYRAQMPVLMRHIPLVGVFNSVLVPRGPTLLLIKGYTGYDQMVAAESRIRGDAGYQQALAELEMPGPPYDSADSALVELADFSPDYVPLKEKPKTGRIFELRYYHTPTERQHRDLSDRFAGIEGQVFHRLGMDPMALGTMVVGPDTRNWVYLTPFNSLAEREKAWDTFAVDPEWVKARAETLARSGQMVTRQNMSLYRAADFSQIQ